MKNILAISASNSSKSINKKVLDLVISKIKDQDLHIELLDLRNYDIPLYSADLEEQSGTPEKIKEIFALIQKFDGYILAVPEHNGNLSAFFKNIFDWLTRIQLNIFGDKDLIIISASPGKSGAASVRSILTGSLPFFGAKMLGHYGIDNFYDTADLSTTPITLPTEIITKLIDLASKLKS